MKLRGRWHFNDRAMTKFIISCEHFNNSRTINSSCLLNTMWYMRLLSPTTILLCTWCREWWRCCLIIHRALWICRLTMMFINKEISSRIIARWEEMFVKHRGCLYVNRFASNDFIPKHFLILSIRRLMTILFSRICVIATISICYGNLIRLSSYLMCTRVQSASGDNDGSLFISIE